MGDLEKRAARRLVIGFDGTTLTPELRELIDMGIGGVILFKRNVVDPWQVAELNRAIGEAARGRPFTIAVDQEGGPVQRLRAPFTELPPMGVVGAIDDPALTQKVGNVLARELLALGFSTDYAPVADVNTNPQNPVIGIRAFGNDPQKVACHAAALVDGLQSAGVMACAKHFPGHGDTAQDSHYELPRLPHPRSRMDAIDLIPFAKCIEHGVAQIMTAHVVFEALHAGTPATLSKTVLTGLLRNEMKFDGLIVSDDLEMKAIASNIGVPAAAVQSLEAGADIVLVCKTRSEVLASIEAVAKRFEKSLPDGTAESEARLDRILQKHPLPPVDLAAAKTIVGCDRHRALADELARRAKEKGISWTPSAAVASSPVSIT